MQNKGIGKKITSIWLALCILVTGIGIPTESKAAETYMVFFDSQGGTYCPYITDIPENTKITLPKPTKERYDFDGWYTDTEYNYMSKVTDSTPIKENLLLYAKWKEKSLKYTGHIVEYTGGPVVVGNYIDKKDVTVVVSYADGTTAVLKEDEYTLDNGFMESVGTKTVWVRYTKNNQSLGSIQVKCVKESVYCIGFDSMGGSFVEPIMSIPPNSTISLPKKPTKKGYVFDGWYMEEDYVTKFTGEEKINKTFIVYAKWVKESAAKETEEEENLWQGELTLQSPVLNVAVGATEAIIVNTMQPGLEIWYGSSNPEVVSVNHNGIITGLKNGRAVIYAYVVDEGIELKCRVGVGNLPYITKIKPKKEEAEVEKGDTHQIKLKVLPKKIDKSQVSYKTSNSSIASVNTNGLVKAKKRGTCYITVKTTDGSNLKEKIKITVY